MRINLFKTRGKKCERCGSTKRIEVHHKTYVRLCNEKSTDLEVLCNLCHAKEHNATPKKIEKVKPKATPTIRPKAQKGIQRLSKKQLITQGYSVSAIKEYQKWWGGK